MYIWILLATIMVTFAFYNVAPRADKEHALNEIKAATIVNRFKAEHSARLHTMECEILYNQNSKDKNSVKQWNGTTSFEDGSGLVSTSLSSQGPVDVTGYEPDYGEGSSLYKSNLPVGYLNGDSSRSNATHSYIYCLRYYIYQDSETEAQKEKEKDPNINLDEYKKGFVDCNAEGIEEIGKKRYFVSFAKIPDRWVSKDGSFTPLPTFVNLLAKASDKTLSFGWTEWVCSKSGSSDCGFVLHGLGNSSAVTMKYDEVSSEAKKFEIKETYEDAEGNVQQRTKDSTVAKMRQEIEDQASQGENGTKNYNYVRYVSRDVALPSTSPLWKNPYILEDNPKEGKINCKTWPCMVAYEVMPIVDEACHCYKIINKENSMTVAKCLNDAYNASKMKETGKKAYTHSSESATNKAIREHKKNVFDDKSYKGDAENWSDHLYNNLITKNPVINDN
jgi:hypothetical protein